MKKLFLGVVVLLALFPLVGASLLATLPTQQLVLLAIEPQLTRIPAPFVQFYVQHLSTLSEKDAGAYPITLLQFVLSDYGLQKSAQGRERNLQIADLILKRGHDINALDSTGLTSVHHAVVNRSPEALQFLIAHGADLNIKSSKGLTPLAFALWIQNHLLRPAEKRSYEPVMVLLQANGAHSYRRRHPEYLE